MRQNYSLLTYEGRNIVVFAGIIFGLVVSKAVLSISTIVLLVNFLASYKEHKFSFFTKENIPNLIPIIFFIASLVWFLFAPNKMLALKEINENLPWLILPLCIVALKKYSNQYLYLFFGLFVLMIAVSAVVVLINYFSNYDFYLKIISAGKSIDTPQDHVRYSLLLSFATITAFYFGVVKLPKLFPKEQWFFVLSFIFFVATLHILSVRTGLITFYLGIIFLVVYKAIITKKWWFIPVVLVLVTLAPYWAYKNVPSFREKVYYMNYDWLQINSNNINGNSDTKRLLSYKIAVNLIKEKPIFGYGICTGKEVMNNFFEEHYPEVTNQNRILPHNQFLFICLEMGFVGLSVFLLVLIVPLYKAVKNFNPLFITLWLMVVASCMVENNLESQVALSMYLFFSSLLLKIKQDE